MEACLSRREFVAALAGAAAVPPAPAGRVAVARCPDYGAGLQPALARLFDQLGGLGGLVRNKTVAIKINLTGSPTYRLEHWPLESTHYTHPRVIAATVQLLGRAGARRIRLLESPWSTADPLEEYMLEAGWEPREFLSAASGVEFENTNWLGRAKKYSRFTTPRGGHIFRAFDLNHSYADCDVFVSLAKMKDHVTAGITLSLKNCFGITPCTIYGEGAAVDDASPVPVGGRGPFHDGNRQPAKCSPAENDPSTPREGGYRIPRIVADICAARPIHLAIVEGIETMAGGEGPWSGPGLEMVRPGVIVAGLNPVSTDAVCMAVMDYDPMAEQLGAGTRDLHRIELAGVPIAQARFSFAKLRAARRRR